MKTLKQLGLFNNTRFWDDSTRFKKRSYRNTMNEEKKAIVLLFLLCVVSIVKYTPYLYNLYSEYTTVTTVTTIQQYNEKIK